MMYCDTSTITQPHSSEDKRGGVEGRGGGEWGNGGGLGGEVCLIARGAER